MKTLSSLLLVWCSACSSAQPLWVESPVPLIGGQYDPSGSLTPFLLFNVRYQQVYSAFDFRSMPTGGGWITAIGVLPGPDSGPFAFFMNDAEIRFSTTAKNPDGLSAIFAENTGTDETIAFRGVGNFVNTPDTPGVELQLGQPFLYDPSDGNLLMDVRMFMGVTRPNPFDPIPTLATVTRLGDGASIAASINLNNPTAEFVGTTALLTYFAITPIPEPGVTVLLFSAIALAGLAHWRRRASVRAPKPLRSVVNP
jgi:hypothetical protein